MDIDFAVCAAPSDAVRDAILAPLAAFNAEHGYPADPQLLAITLTDSDGTIVGGLWGRTVYDWLFVDYFVLPAALRGRDLGTRLLEEAERIARTRGCVDAWLTTFSFQAQGFYEGCGYTVFGTLPHSPRDNVRIFLSKRLVPDFG